MNKIFRNVLIFSVAFATITPFAVLRAVGESTTVTADNCASGFTTISGNLDSCLPYTITSSIEENLENFHKSLIPALSNGSRNENILLSEYDKDNLFVRVIRRGDQSYKIYNIFYNLNNKQTKGKLSDSFNFNGESELMYSPEAIFESDNGTFFSFEKQLNNTYKLFKNTPEINTLDYSRTELGNADAAIFNEFTVIKINPLTGEVYYLKKNDYSNIYNSVNFGSSINHLVDLNQYGGISKNINIANVNFIDLNDIISTENEIFFVSEKLTNDFSCVGGGAKRNVSFLKASKNLVNQVEYALPMFESCNFYFNIKKEKDGNIWLFQSQSLTSNNVIKYNPITQFYENIQVDNKGAIHFENVVDNRGNSFYVVEQFYLPEENQEYKLFVKKIDSKNRAKAIYSSQSFDGMSLTLPDINFNKRLVSVGNKIIVHVASNSNEQIYSLAQIDLPTVSSEEGDNLPSYSNICELKTKTQAYAEFAGRVFEAKVNPNNNKRILIRSTSDGVFGGINQQTGEIDTNEEWVNLPGYQRRKIINVGFFVKDTKMFMFAKGRLNGTNKIFFRVIREDLSMSGWKEAKTTTQKNRAKKAFTCAY